MLIGEIVRQSGLSRDTIRYYERLGLLKTVGRPVPTNDYKAYAPDTLDRLRSIKLGKHLGFSLTEIAEGLQLYDRDQFNEVEIEAWLVEKIAQVEEKVQLLQTLRRDLHRSLDQLHGGRCSLTRVPGPRPLPAGSPASGPVLAHAGGRR